MLILLKLGAKVRYQDRYQNTPLHWASRWGIEMKSKKLSNPSVHLLKFAFSGHDKVAKLLLDYASDVTAKDNEGNTPLHLASAGGER